MIDYRELLALALPQIVIVATALIVMAVDLLALRRSSTATRFTVAALLGSVGCAIAIARITLAPVQANIANGVLIGNPFTNLAQIAILALTIATLLLAANATFTRHIGEYVLLILLATAGMLFLVATQDLLVIFVSIELLSLSLYILAAFNKQSRFSWEAALKYFLFGGMSAAFLLFGFSILYGLSNSTSLPIIATSIHGLSPLLVIAIVTITVGLGFKVAAAPFHFWAPDVYQAAPAPSAAFIASGSKVASFIVFFQLAAIGLAGAQGTATLGHFVRGWVPVVAIIAAVSMLLGNFVAIRQRSVRRLLAYSAVAHAGYMLLAIAAHTPQSLAALVYYVVTYSVATIGAFAVLGAIEARTGSDLMADLAGLSRREPVLSFCLGLFLLSLAGIPPLAGFFGKFYLFVAALQSTPGSMPLLWLVILALATSAVSLYYYLRVLKAIYITKPEPASAHAFPSVECHPDPEQSEGEGSPYLPPPGSSASIPHLLVILLAAAIVLLGAAPNLILTPILKAIQSSGI
ncbi:MAG TPA: NADH-quinone oxidoreductase subunit N [Acidobacteriaceae bacterium]|jgi:NADH-quinone oxidoreductase subunit N|nr:NADH-quinone oxidoreductase subunit N [Acidobacteriaceae bacterium]